MKPVLVLGSQPRIAVTIARSLHRRGIPVHVATLTPHEPRPTSRAIRGLVHLPTPRQHPDEFITALVRAIDAHGFDTILPCSDPALAALAQFRDRLAPLVHLGCPSAAAVARVLDKEATLAVAVQCGIRVPAPFTVTDPADLERLRSSLRFPIVGKPLSKSRRNGYKVRYFESGDDLRAAMAADPDFGRWTLLQEYCPGEGVGIEVLMSGGAPLAMFQHRRVREFPATGGVSVVAAAEPVDPALAEAAVTLLRALEWDGVAMVEFRYDSATRTAVLMEVNGRYWGSLPLPVDAGVDFPFYHWQVLHGERLAVSEHPRTGIRMRWLAGDLRRLHAAFVEARARWMCSATFWRELWRFMADGLPPSRDALWRFSDPRPALGELGRTIKELIGQDVKALRSRRQRRPMTGATPTAASGRM